MNKNTTKYLLLFVKQYYIWAVIAIFSLYLISVIMKTPSISGKFFFLIMGSSIIIGGIYYEYLKKIYQKMIIAQTQRLDLALAKQYQEQLEKLDFFHGFKGSIILFDTLCLIDQQNYLNCLQHLKKNEAFFKAKLDYLFIFYYHQLLCYYFLDQTTNARVIMAKLKQFKTINQKKLSPLFSFEQIDGIEYLLNNRNQKGLATLEAIDTHHFNPREKILHYQIMLKVAKQKQETKRIINYQKTIQNLTGGEKNETIK
ncbi:hypothetical protein [Enterococcus columbae]|uniref:Uncharacterized protein n=1 Tax=Enterococcus columbae DSM 7374 = ATCC 51263 TaxID=1121865 RepID=S1MU20_9ENTE|nr:hypothetical protein [Enterococcus columbae]EOT40546.1 hypothetical protein OMW_01408 [Enterococcus columbae DSM 7374 = ATCC 51263]EOW80322.1 hypothetical protein I568_02022 [Enterococcus columbae DSM 7374 = ATCC 51263]OJG25520.1 hypothetical protein RR47_GL001569 [Enterococcus columbae DSM 7374 = ATCC 51263]